jgi:hypothetical protein
MAAIFRNQPTRNKNCLWHPCLLTDREEIGNLYKGPSIDASYQVSVQFQGRRFLEIDQSETRIACFLFLIGGFLKKSSPLKQLYQMNRNLVRSILGRASIKIARLVSIH